MNEPHPVIEELDIELDHLKRRLAVEPCPMLQGRYKTLLTIREALNYLTVEQVRAVVLSVFRPDV